MRCAWTIPFAIAAGVLLGNSHVAGAAPIKAQPLGVDRLSIVEPAEVYRGPRGGAAYRGPRGGAAVRGPRGAAAVRGPRGNVAVRGPYRGGAYRAGAYRVGGRYYGGVWYGTGRRYWNGRWWAYGVGTCWRASPIGYVWVCG